MTFDGSNCFAVGIGAVPINGVGAELGVVRGVGARFMARTRGRYGIGSLLGVCSLAVLQKVGARVARWRAMPGAGRGPP